MSIIDTQFFWVVRGRRKTYGTWVDFPAIGTITPEVWLVGDRHNHPFPKAKVLFWGEGGCGAYLRRAMNGVGLTWEDTFLSNSVDDLGFEVDLQDWHTLGSPKVVALGNNASARLTASGIPHNKVPHPQYWMRFRYNDLGGYIELLRKGAGR